MKGGYYSLGHVPVHSVVIIVDKYQWRTFIIGQDKVLWRDVVVGLNIDQCWLLFSPATGTR